LTVSDPNRGTLGQIFVLHGSGRHPPHDPAPPSQLLPVAVAAAAGEHAYEPSTCSAYGLNFFLIPEAYAAVSRSTLLITWGGFDLGRLLEGYPPVGACAARVSALVGSQEVPWVQNPAARRSCPISPQRRLRFSRKARILLLVLRVAWIPSYARCSSNNAASIGFVWFFHAFIRHAA